MKYTLPLLLAACFATSCSAPGNKSSIEQWKAEVVEAERQFAEMAKNEGIHEAFLEFAADDAVLLRNKTLVKGKEAMKARFEKSSSDNESTLTWAPDFVDVAASGDLAYTYGPYTFTSTDSLGNVSTSEGYFHTVWKRQSDGRWKFVWD